MGLGIRVSGVPLSRVWPWQVTPSLLLCELEVCGALPARPFVGQDIKGWLDTMFLAHSVARSVTDSSRGELGEGS